MSGVMLFCTFVFGVSALLLAASLIELLRMRYGFTTFRPRRRRHPYS